MKIIVEGLYLIERLTGVQRFSTEVVNRLAEKQDLELVIVIPEDSEIVNPYPQKSNVSIVRYKSSKIVRTYMWRQIYLKRYAKKNKLPLLCTENIAPVYKKSYVVIHDVAAKEPVKRDKNFFKFSLLYGMAYKIAVKHSCRIFTVSNFSKNRLMHFYPKLKKEGRQPIVCGSGYEGIYAYGSENITGVDNKFYLAVRSLHANKNFKYVLSLAKNNPDKQFVIVGGSREKFVQDELQSEKLSNCNFVGRVTDEQLKWLYTNCEGFIQPSVYEGFGLPPLEALACGCKNIYCSDIEVFRELYDGVAKFFDPYDYTNTVELIDNNISEDKIKWVLNKYTWDNVANVIYNTIKQDCEKGNI